MRELNRKDIVMLENVMRMLKQVQFRSMEFDEALAVGQTYGWLQGFLSELKLSVSKAEQEKALLKAFNEAKEVKDGEPESGNDALPNAEHDKGIQTCSGSAPKDGCSGGGSASIGGAPQGMGSNEGIKQPEAGRAGGNKSSNRSKAIK